MKLKDIIDRSILKERGKIYSYITSFYSEINREDIRSFSAEPEKEIIGRAFEIEELRKRYLKHIKDCLKNDLYCDIAADILIQNGRCIIDRDTFGNLLKGALEKAVEDKSIYYNTINFEKDDNDLIVSPERLRDYRIYAACVKEAYMNDIVLTKQDKGDANITSQEKSVLNCLAEQLGLSNIEARGLYMSQRFGEGENPFIRTDDMIKKLVNEGIIINVKNMIYTPEEIISMIREARGITIERKYLRRIISNMDDKTLNMIRRRHNINASTREDKIKCIVENDVSPRDIFGCDIYPENTSENDKKKIFNDFVSLKLGIDLEKISGRTLDAKIDSLIDYYGKDLNDAVDTISKDGYEQLINILRNCNKLDKAIGSLDFAQNIDITANLLLDYDIFAKDLLYRLSDDDLREICDFQKIKYFKNMNTMMLVSRIIDNVNSMENLLIENYLFLAINDSVTLSQKGIVRTTSDLGIDFQNTTQNIFERLRIKIADYDNPGRKKERPDIILDFGEEGIVIVECKSGKNPYAEYAKVYRQMESYFNSYSKEYKVHGMLLVANSFTDDFIADAKSNIAMNLSIMTAQSLLQIYNELKGKKFKIQPWVLIKELVVDPDLVIKRALNAK